MVKPRSLRSTRLVLAGGACLAALLAGPAAFADPKPVAAPAPTSKPKDEVPLFASTRDPVMEKASDQRRSGFALNLSFGNGIASVVGYPNEPKKIGYARYYHESGARPSGFNMLWLGGAITDWFTFGVGFSGSSLNFTGKTTVAAGGLIFHTEIFPLFYRGGTWKDVGVAFDAGLGSATIQDDTVKQSEVEVTTPAMTRVRVPYFAQPKEKIVDGGSASQIGIGVFYEAAKLWRVRIAPFVYANYIWSESVRRPGLFLGVHGTLYWKPTKD